MEYSQFHMTHHPGLCFLQRIGEVVEKSQLLYHTIILLFHRFVNVKGVYVMADRYV